MVAFSSSYDRDRCDRTWWVTWWKIYLDMGVGWGHVTLLKNLEPVYVFGTVKYRNFVFGTTCISHRMTAITPKVGVVRSHDLILQYNVKVGNKTANIHVKNLSVWNIVHSAIPRPEDPLYINVTYGLDVGESYCQFLHLLLLWTLLCRVVVGYCRLLCLSAMLWDKCASCTTAVCPRNIGIWSWYIHLFWQLQVRI